ncbi:6993_t:CDS:10 [Paraglomus brasilianum]|uniref:Glutathione synthetase n=1 Tax=Paraglomus brasilianum TaxID=144538 RepID=A0A9N9A4B1_9GLOM|nr:6993_t:CDS:10 [Paraglomus brasilianum]
MTLQEDYPPRLLPEKYQTLKEQTIDWSIANSLVIRPTAEVALPQNISVIHAPVALFPSPIPREAFEEAVNLQPIFNELYHKMSLDDAFIKSTIQKVSEVDDFVKKLYDIYLKTKDKVQVSSNKLDSFFQQHAFISAHKSDYLLHMDEGEVKSKILQVEFNTIAASFSSLSALTGKLHKYLVESTGYFDANARINTESLPENASLTSLPKGIAKAHELYGSSKAVVMMVVQPGERNAFDQRWIEYNLLQNHKVHLIRKTLAEVSEEASVDPVTSSLTIAGKEISVVYYRAGYSPDDYPTEKQWEARLLIEKSKAIKCPTVAYQLVGAKKAQQEIAKPGMIQRYINDPIQVKKLYASFAELYPLDTTPEGEAAAKLALENPERYVMKPQREGGGNNIYTKDIPPALARLSVSERSSYILMELIKPPPMKNTVLREGELISGPMASELGIYGIFIATQDGEVLVNEPAGHLLRTKSADMNEGGVATGFAVLDSPLLV